MTQPENPTGVALQYVREELATLRAAVHDELTAMRTDLSGLAGELRGYSAEQGPRIAVLEHRVGECEKDILSVKLTFEKVQEKSGDRRWLLYLALLTAMAALAGAFVAPLIVR